MRPLFLALVAASPAFAAPDEGCYTRHYSESHLAANPAQVVANIWVQFSSDAERGESVAAMGATLASGGHVADTLEAGMYLEQGLICVDGSDPFTCAVECDGGSFRVVRNTFEAIDIQTDYLLIGDTEGCGGVVDLAEAPGQTGAPTTYRLFKSPPDGCVVN